MSNVNGEKVAVITGGGGSIARAISRALACSGYRIVLWDKDRNAALETASILESEGHDVLVEEVDLMQDKTVVRAVNRTLEKYGQIDALINNAGIFELTPVSGLDMAKWDLILAINLRGPVVCVRECLPAMIEQRAGSIINISSISAVVARKHNLAYAASKAALLRVTQDLALDLSEFGIRVNSITPGSTDTPMIRNYEDPDAMRKSMLEGNLEQFRIGIPLRKLGTPEDHAAVIEFLVSEKAQHITGQNIVVDGGQTLA